MNGRASNLGKMLQRLQSAKTLQTLYEISVSEKSKAMTGYDRVLIYRFEEGHGQVIAEASAPSMELFNGLFFPASTFRNRPASCTAPTGCESSPMPTTSRCRCCKLHPDTEETAG